MYSYYCELVIFKNYKSKEIGTLIISDLIRRSDSDKFSAKNLNSGFGRRRCF